MSRNMQMRVSILPYYKKGFRKDYPKIAHELRHADHILGENDPSLFELVGRLDKILYELEGNASARDIFLKHRKVLFRIYEETEAQIADWQLAKADKALYKIEDIFDEIEKELGKI